MWTSADEYLEQITKEAREKDVEWLNSEIERLKDIIKERDEKIAKIRSAIINNCRPEKDILEEIWNIIFNRKTGE